jgi:hypothetical protein
MTRRVERMIGLTIALVALQSTMRVTAQVSPPLSAAGPVRFTPDADSSDEPLTLYRRTGNVIVSGALGNRNWSPNAGLEYERLCTGHCDLSLAPGIYQFAVGIGADPSENVVPIRRDFRLFGGDTLLAHRDDRAGVHVAGWCVFALGVLGGIGVPLWLGTERDPSAHAVPIAISISAGTAALAAGLLMIFVRPTADLSVQR